MYKLEKDNVFIYFYTVMLNIISYTFEAFAPANAKSVGLKVDVCIFN